MNESLIYMIIENDKEYLKLIKFYFCTFWNKEYISI